MNHNRYAFLDGIRGMAAIFVLTRHTNNYWHFSLYRSYLAVDLFFILSGFVIAYAYDEKIKTGAITFQRFVLIRLIRLYPVFLLSLLISAILLIGNLAIKHQVTFPNLSQALSIIAITAIFLPSHMEGSYSLFPGNDHSLFPINDPYWSLFYELLSNFIYAAIRSLLNNVLLTTIVLLFGISVTVVSRRHGNLDVGYLWNHGSLIAGFCRSIFGVFLGLFIYRHQAKFGQYFSKPNAAWAAFAVVAIILASPSSERFDWVIDAFSVAIIFPIAVLCASQGKSSRLQGLLLMLGSVSYPIYVLHAPVGEIVALLFRNIVESFAPFSGVIFVLILTTLSVWIERYYDIPLRKLLSNYVFKRGHREKPAAS
jgi:peptidoglycan/LPS O-acetylase OafA/YrhL